MIHGRMKPCSASLLMSFVAKFLFMRMRSHDPRVAQEHN
jgi:hypothetical protein